MDNKQQQAKDIAKSLKTRASKHLTEGGIYHTDDPETVFSQLMCDVIFLANCYLQERKEG